MLALAALVPGSGQAQPSIQRSTVDCGGGSSTGGAFVLRGTAGQPDAGLMTGGPFSLAGGFWFGGAAVSAVPGLPPEAPFDTRLLPIAPNPGRGPFALAFSLARPEVVRIELVDVAGRRVRTLLDEPRSAGRHAMAWDGADGRGRMLPNGAYFLRFTAGGFVARQKVLVLR